ncbi:MAG TPA: peptide chain release factor 1 [Lentisphaeria bacterium]|nr:MAG: peptide chain release factor 1 [Lentisphaerae bacterium GWF2_49_21]HBC87841.1 peptide chain release factor 1 [Lentisphaeria bacterium]
MTPSEIAPHIEKLKKRLEELKVKLSDPSIYTRQDECRKISREHQKLEDFFKNFSRWTSLLDQLDENRKMLSAEKDEELKSLISADIQNLENETPVLEKKIRLSLIPQDPNDSKNIIVEIRPAAGGEEASLFTAELFRMYQRYAESKGWKVELLDLSSSGMGGMKEVVFSLAGDNVYSRIKYEGGVHRVQRVPATESSGRIHTSTATVSVLPEIEEFEFELRAQDLKFDVFRASGNGGQSVNTTDSAVRATHIPTGISVASQQEKSQHKNKAIAIRILRARIYEIQKEAEDLKNAEAKRSQTGTGDRSEKIRTYNFHQNRVTDHRFGITIHDIPGILDGDLDNLLDQIILIECDRKLKAL